MDNDISKRLQEAVEWLKKEYTGIRTGQANPGLLDGIKVESYGAQMPLNQVANVGAEDARTLRISPWDAGTIGAIETALRDANLGLSVATDSSGLRAIFPELTVERREQLMKLAKSKLEEARITVRAIRDAAMKQIDADEKTGEISEDDKFTQKDEVQKAVESTNESLEGIYNKKAEELKA